MTFPSFAQLDALSGSECGSGGLQGALWAKGASMASMASGTLPALNAAELRWLEVQQSWEELW